MPKGAWFNIVETMLNRIFTIAAIWVVAGTASLDAQDIAPGRKTFESRCSVCHGADGNGGELGPAITRKLAGLSDPQLRTTILEGLPGRGMPANNVSEADMPPLVDYVKTLRPRAGAGFGFQSYSLKAPLTNGKTLDGMVIAESFEDAALRTPDKAVHLLRKVEGGRFREVTSEVNWTTYNGDIGGNRFTSITQIDKSNVKRIAPRWNFTLPNVARLAGDTAGAGWRYVCDRAQ